jgi:hypothetical protein
MGKIVAKQSDSNAVQQLQDHIAAIHKLIRRTRGDIIEIGRRLAIIKELAGYGNWLPLLEQEYDWDERTVQRFMSVYGLSLKYDKLSDLSLPDSGLYLLAAPSTPDEVQADVIARAENGEKFTHEQIKEMVTDAKVPKLKPRAEARRIVKLGDDYERLQATSLGSPKEMDALIELKDHYPDVANNLIERAVAGEPEGAIAICNALRNGVTITAVRDALADGHKPLEPSSDDDDTDHEAAAAAEEHTRELLAQRPTFIPMLLKLNDAAQHMDPCDMAAAITDEFPKGLSELAWWCTEVSKELVARKKLSK